MINTKPKICKASWHAGLSPSIGKELKVLLDRNANEHELQSFLNKNPEIIGSRFSWGTSPTIVKPQLKLGNEFIVDFIVIDSPQWTDIYLIEIKPTNVSVFNKDRTYSKHLSRAIKQTNDWRTWVTDNKYYFSKLVKNLLDATNVDDNMIKEYNFYNYNYMVLALKKGYRGPKKGFWGLKTGYWGLKTGIVIGRRWMYEDKKEMDRRKLLEHTDLDALFSYDALLDVCKSRMSEE